MKCQYFAGKKSAVRFKRPSKIASSDKGSPCEEASNGHSPQHAGNGDSSSQSSNTEDANA